MAHTGRKPLGAALAVLAAVACAALLAAHALPTPFAAAQNVLPRAAKRAAPAAQALPAGTVDVNTADVAALCTLKGVGPALAQAIVSERELNGPFSYPEDLIVVKGIGAKTLARFRDQLDFRAR